MGMIKDIRILYKMIKVYPVIVNIIVLLSIFSTLLSYWVFDIVGASIYTMIICIVASYPFKLCNWYRTLCMSAILALTLEWVDTNICIIPHYMYIIQSIVMAGTIISIILFSYGRKDKKSNNKGSEKADI